MKEKKMPAMPPANHWEQKAKDVPCCGMKYSGDNVAELDYNAQKLAEYPRKNKAKNAHNGSM